MHDHDDMPESDVLVDRAAPSFASVGAFVREVGTRLAEAFERMRPAFLALANAVVKAIEGNLRACGLLVRSRTTKAERRTAKRFLAARRRSDPDAPRLGIAHAARCARWPATALNANPTISGPASAARA